MALITRAHSYCISIIDFKVLSIVIIIINSKTYSNGIYSFESYGVSIGFGFNNSKTFDSGCFNSFDDGVAEPRDEYERVSTGTSLYDSTPL